MNSIAGTKFRFCTTTVFEKADAPLTVVAVLIVEYGPRLPAASAARVRYRYVVDAVTLVSV